MVGVHLYLHTSPDDAWVTNVEDIFQDQVPAGIKNRITDKVQTEKVILAEAPYGFSNPTASAPDNFKCWTMIRKPLSPLESMQQLFIY